LTIKSTYLFDNEIGVLRVLIIILSGKPPVMKGRSKPGAVFLEPKLYNDDLDKSFKSRSSNKLYDCIIAIIVYYVLVSVKIYAKNYIEKSHHYDTVICHKAVLFVAECRM
jgi:hypothetical protein